MSEITFENFWDKVKLFSYSVAGRGSQVGYILDRSKEKQVNAWVDYCERKGWHGRAKFFRTMIERGSSLTVPCEHPWVFEPSVYDRRPYTPKPKPEPVKLTPAQRAAVAARALRPMREATQKPNDPKSPPAGSPAAARDYLETLDPADGLPKLSDAALFGQKRPLAAQFEGA